MKKNLILLLSSLAALAVSVFLLVAPKPGDRSTERFVVDRVIGNVAVQVSLPAYPDAGVTTPLFVDARDSSTHEGSKGPVAMRFTLPGASSDTVTLAAQPDIPGIFTGEYKFPAAGKYKVSLYIGAAGATSSFDFEYVVALGVPQSPQPQTGGKTGSSAGRGFFTPVVLIAIVAAVLFFWVLMTIIRVRVRVRVRVRKK